MSYISLEANIGVGKSTLLPKLAEALGVNPIEEDLSEEGEFLKALGEYNKDKSKAIDLQLTINEYRAQVATNSLMGEHLVERSMLSDMVFAKVMNDRGEISNGDYKLFKAVSETNLSMNPPIVAVYLYCDPKVSYERMKGRNRSEESNVSLEYMTQLEKAHEDMLPEICFKLDIPLVRIDYTNFADPDRIAKSIKTMKELVYYVK